MASELISNTKSFLNRPPIVVNSHLDGLTIDTGNFGPLSNVISFVIKSYKSCFRAVKNLLGICSPSAVLVFVVSIVINPIKRMLGGWSITHVIKKVRKIMPSFAYFNTSSSIPRISFYTRKFTTSKHMTPRSIFFGNFSLQRMPMSIHSMLSSRWHSRHIIEQAKGGINFG